MCVQSPGVDGCPLTPQFLWKKSSWMLIFFLQGFFLDRFQVLVTSLYYDIHDRTAILQSLGFQLATSSSLDLVGTPRCQFWISMSKKRQTLNCRPHLVCTKNHQSSHDSYSIWNKAHSMIGGSIVVLVSSDPATESLWYKRDSVLPKTQLPHLGSLASFSPFPLTSSPEFWLCSCLGHDALIFWVPL